MPQGRHRGASAYGPYFTRQLRHGNRNQAGSRSSVVGTTLLLLPEDIDGEAPTKYTGRHRVKGSHSHRAVSPPPPAE